MILSMLLKQVGLVNLQQGRRRISAFQVSAQPNKLPALAMDHGRVADSLEQMNAIDHRGQRIVDAGAELHLRVRRVHLVVKPVKPLPLFTRYLFANLTRVLPRSVYAERDGNRAQAVEDQLARHGFQIAVPLHACRVAKRSHHALPARLGTRVAGIKHQAHGYVELTDGVLRPLQVAAHPVETVANTRKHGSTLPNSVYAYYSSPHVSLLPPPCEELTTRDPLSRATRVSPPGTMFTLSPKRT